MKFSMASIILFISLQSQAVSSKSIYNLQSQWTNSQGQTVSLVDMKGHVLIMSMAYTKCRASCPVLVQDIKRILEKLPPDIAAKIRIEIFSFDHKKENTESLAAFRKKMKIEGEQWNVYKGDKNSIADLAAVLGVQYKPLQNGEFVHSNNIILINKDGEVVKTIEGFGGSSDEFIGLLKKAAGG